MRIAPLALVVGTALGGQETGTILRVSGSADFYLGSALDGTLSSSRRFAGGAPFASSASRFHMPDLDLALVDGTMLFGAMRAHFALQFGRSVEAYRRQPGPSAKTLSYIKHANIGVRLARKLWLDAGLLPSHIGIESWVSHENLTATRSILAEYAPRYFAGARLSWQPTSWLISSVQGLKGWDAVTQPEGIGVGARFDVRLAESVLLSGFNLLIERPDGRVRTLHGLGARGEFGRATMQLQADIGSQENSSPGGRAAHWWGYSFVSRLRVTAATWLSARFERFDDDKQIVLITGDFDGTPNSPFRAYGESLGFDAQLRANILVRTEIRAFQNSGPAFPPSDTINGRARRATAFAISSISVWF